MKIAKTELRASIKKLLELRDRLNDIDTQIAEQLREFEKLLQENNPLSTLDAYYTDIGEGQTLIFGYYKSARRGYEWRLLVKNRSANRRFDEVVLLLDASRDTRARAAACLDKLIGIRVSRRSK